ncbi:MAG TPA: acetyl-CoA carboxylase biotin carboxyl carrier protein [Terriglobales bacterium]|nr:acetyl-CoA carboxylase biotin carboxyl carrier protein [Terriglobales bacterium]
MNQKELKELIEFLKEQDIAEFELERGDVKVRIKRGSTSAPETRYVAIPSSPPSDVAAQVPAGVTHAPPSKAVAPTEAPAEEGLHIVRSPIVGTFYESPSPGSPPFIKIGDVVEVGQVLCIVEAMKLMNEIESDVSGEIVKKLVNNGQAIEYGQELFAIRSK